jgi:hypothetical protein
MLFRSPFLNFLQFPSISFSSLIPFPLLLQAIGLYLLSLLSRRAEKKVRGIFLDKINGGGLSLLNEVW